jgi:molybdopterin/thiamine biosynthesis adenylyltransferase
MRYTLTFWQPHYEELNTHLFQGAQRPERVAFLLCGIAKTERETRLLVREVVPIEDADLLEQSHQHLSVSAASFMPVMKRADRERACLVFVHSHPDGVTEHSIQDDREEAKLFRAAYNRISTPEAIHGSLVLSSPQLPRARVRLDAGGTRPIDTVRVIGDRFRFYSRPARDHVDMSFHDRQVRAFGPDIQALLRGLTIGVIGVGGTGSAVIEQLIRLGVGRLVISEAQALDSSNVSRVYGSQVDDVGEPKLTLASRLATRIGLGTVIEPVDKPTTYASAMKRFRECDVIFGCTDDSWSRAILTRFCVEYCIPAFDLGVKISSKDGVILAIAGRVTTLLPRRPCLYCRGQITPEDVTNQILFDLDPDEAANQRRQRYIPELPDAEPAVIAFTTATAAMAVAELLHRLTGFKGTNDDFGELVIRFDHTAIRTPGAVQNGGCFCADPSLIGRGDRPRFLDQTWRPE